MGIAITVNARITVLMAKDQAPRPATLTSFPNQQRQHDELDQPCPARPPAIRIANPLIRGKPRNRSRASLRRRRPSANSGIVEERRRAARTE
jgi:hypothetical protein